MRKYYLLMAYAMLIISCSKENSPSKSSHDPVPLVKSWLQSQKSKATGSQTIAIDKLSGNLDFSRIRIEQYNSTEKFAVIPIGDDFKSQMNISPNATALLITVLTNDGQIGKGNVVIFKPGQGSPGVPEGTFEKMFNEQPIGVSGEFEFFSATGRNLFELNFENGRLKSFGTFERRAQGNSNGTTSTDTETCTAYCLTVTHYENGEVVDQTEELLWVDCDSGGSGSCSDPYVICFNLEDGSNSGNQEALDYEFNATNTVTWHVHNTKGGQILQTGVGVGVHAYDRFKGKRKASEPQGGYFFNVIPMHSECNDNDFFYMETSHTFGIIPQSASVTVVGQYNPWGGGVWHQVNRTRVFSFSEVF